MSDENDYLDISPKTNLIRSYRADNIDYVLLVGEGVDNAFDADADHIVVTVDKDMITFQDDGRGLAKDRIQALFSLGEHAEIKRGLGRFGIGIKAQAINAGNIMEVVSTSVDGRVRARVDWRVVLAEGLWRIRKPKWELRDVSAPHGTTIIISDLRRAPAIHFERFKRELAERFYPAIKVGKTISLNGSMIELLPDPPMTDVVTRTLELSKGRTVELRAGILEQPGKLWGVDVCYLHRTIMPHSATGCKEFTGIRKLFCRLQLTGPWHLAQFKNALTDEDEKEELNDAVFGVLQPLLEKINEASMDVRLDDIIRRVHELLPGELAATPRGRKAKPNPDPDKRKREAGKVDPDKADVGKGPAKSRKPAHRLMITWDGDADEDGIGSFQPGQPHRVNLSKGDPTIATLLKLRDDEVIAHQIRLIALAIYEQGRDQTRDDPELALESFGKRLAKLLALQTADDAKKTKAS